MDQVVEITAATTNEAATLARLMQLYLHDFSEFAPLDTLHGEMAANGRFDYPNLASYWSEAHREPLLLRVSARLAGFVLVNDWSASGRPVDFAIAEFFVGRKYRRNGIGTQAARQVIAARCGVWEVAVAAYNRPALAFWSKTLPSIHQGAREAIESNGSRWTGTIFRFEQRTYRQDASRD